MVLTSVTMRKWIRVSGVRRRASAGRPFATPDNRPPTRAILASLVLLWASIATAQEPKILNANPDWPCIQHKVATLTAAQMWDGPPVEGLEGWRDMPEIEKLLPTLTSRRVPLEQAAAAIDAFAAAQPKDKRDEALKQLFAAAGLHEFVLCLGYKGNVIKEYFLNYEVLESDFTLELGSKRLQLHNERDKSNWIITCVMPEASLPIARSTRNLVRVPRGVASRSCSS